MFTRVFWRDTAERAVKTAAQTAVAYVSAAGALDVLAVDWASGLSLAGGAAVLSVLTSLGSLPIGRNGTASLVPQVVRRGRHAAPEE